MSATVTKRCAGHSGTTDERPILLPGLPADLTPQKIIDFLKSNGNVLLTVSAELSELYRDFAREFDLDFEERGTQMIDHFASVKGDSDHSTILVPTAGQMQRLPAVFPFPASQSELPFVYKGVGHRLGSNPLAFSILRPSQHSYSFEPPSSGATLEKLDNPDRRVLLGSDAEASLISAFQLLDTDRRHADQQSPKRSGTAGRVVWCGSMVAFSNEYVEMKDVKSREGGVMHPGTSNLQVLSTLVSWLTQSHGVLRVEATSHERVKAHEGDTREPYEEWQVDEGGEQRHMQSMYRIMDTVTFHIDIAQRTPTGWTPAPADLDLQVSLVMLDPYITTNLTATLPRSHVDTLSSVAATTATSTRYSSTFKLPDKHGVYTFLVDWKRHGWSYIHTRDTAPVRPFNHDEHPRGLHSAWPYVAGASSTVAAFLLFAFLWVCSNESDKGKAKSKSE